eukprot:1152360-Pelagomonas_calceolata.AAC.1
MPYTQYSKHTHKAKALGLHNSICPPPASFASELIGLPARKTKLDNKYQSKRSKDSFSQTLPPDIHNAFQNWTHATQEEMASPLDLTLNTYTTALTPVHSSWCPTQFTLIQIYGKFHLPPHL